MTVCSTSPTMLTINFCGDSEYICYLFVMNINIKIVYTLSTLFINKRKIN